ncbi:hypothetical protein [Streptomyces sp. NPDC002205]|uniref:hypothetical protein n=1 Tax=Streptomyces sp. NPDC002205 TaxID=3154411 RepID=UPI003334320B
MTYLNGYGAGARGSALLGFREWPPLKLGRQSSFVWSSLVTEPALPGVSRTYGHRNLTEEQDQVVVEALCQFLGTFLRDGDTERDGLQSSFRDCSLRFAE